MIDFTPSEQAIFTAFVAFLGTAIGAYAAIKVAEVHAKSKERAEARKLIISMAVENWKIGVNRGMETEPIEHFLIHMAKVFDLFLDKKIDAKGVAKSMGELRAIVEVLRAEEKKAQQDATANEHTNP
jgi:hypothetical protein